MSLLLNVLVITIWQPRRSVKETNFFFFSLLTKLSKNFQDISKSKIIFKWYVTSLYDFFFTDALNKSWTAQVIGKKT